MAAADSIRGTSTGPDYGVFERLFRGSTALQHNSDRCCVPLVWRPVLSLVYIGFRQGSRPPLCLSPNCIALQHSSARSCEPLVWRPVLSLVFVGFRYSNWGLPKHNFCRSWNCRNVVASSIDGNSSLQIAVVWLLKRSRCRCVMGTCRVAALLGAERMCSL